MISPLISYDFAAKIIYDFAVTNLMFSPLFRMISPLMASYEFAANFLTISLLKLVGKGGDGRSTRKITTS